MALPSIESISDSSLEASQSGVQIFGNFGAVEGNLWLFQNNSVGNPGLTDQLTAINSWFSGLVDFDLPGSFNNGNGAAFLFVENLEGWSTGYPITLTVSVPTIGAPDRVAPIRFRRRVAFPFGGFT